jgi:hypothetical protein
MACDRARRRRGDGANNGEQSAGACFRIRGSASTLCRGYAQRG